MLCQAPLACCRWAAEGRLELRIARYDTQVLSLIVPAHNEEQVIERTIASIHSAAGEVHVPYELIVVDDASTDRTAEIARAHGARVIPVNYRQIARARNAGAAVAADCTAVDRRERCSRSTIRFHSPPA